MSLLSECVIFNIPARKLSSKKSQDLKDLQIVHASLSTMLKRSFASEIEWCPCLSLGLVEIIIIKKNFKMNLTIVTFYCHLLFR